ncbi:hypothetical protein ANO14919_031530 [Xylariales sp. No.14919]|nr:hypothetical protein ANO14919_031530 [Xylariales sp. No.14919]
MFTITRERLWLIGLRQAWALSTPNAKRVSSRTVLFLSAPEDALEQNNMIRYFGNGAIRIWPVTKLEALQTLVSERDALVEKLESEEALLIYKANSWNVRKFLEGERRYRLSYSDIPDLVKMGLRLRSKLITSPFGPRFGFFYRKEVDTIQLLRDQIKEKGELIEESRRNYGIGELRETMSDPTAQFPMFSKDRLIGTLRDYFPKLDVLSSNSKEAAVFVEFKTQTEAQRACQQVASSNFLALMPRYIGVKPNEIIWDNLTVPPLRRLSQEYIALVIIILTIVFWSVPSSLIGIVSNISYLAENFESLGFLNSLPDPVIGLLSGLLPPLLTSYLSKDVPTMYRNVFTSFGGPIETVNELKVQQWGYVFQVTQVFLVTAVFSGAATVASQVADVRAIPVLLATQLPKSSNYYLTYFIVQGITSAADSLLNYSNVLDYLSVEYLIDETPRQKFKRYTNMKDIAWGDVFPKFTNFAIIAIAYSCIAPLVLGFAAAGLSLYYFSYRYNLFYVMQPKIDTKGQAYTLALRQLLTGVYIAELVLIGLFGLRKAKGPVVMAVMLLIVTILYSVLMNRYLSPLEKLLPTDLASSAERDDETTPLLSSMEEGRGARSIAEDSVKCTARFSNPRAFTSDNFMKSWVRGEKDYDMEDHEVPEYTEKELERAYLHPALTSPTPLIWMARDAVGASKNEVQETEECGLKASDEGAWLDGSRIVRWDVGDFEKVPVWKKVVKY